MPPPNDRRRMQLADAAITLLAAEGVHGVTHRSVERQAGLPVGTAANYFRTREALLMAAAERVVARHQADMTAAASVAPPTADAVSLISESLFTAATTHRARYLAIFELRLESLRRPALAATLTGLSADMVAFTARHHATVGLAFPPDRVTAMVGLYGGALFTLVSSPPEETTRDTAQALAEAIVRSAGRGANERVGG
jgi:AcrR family transcriptional regulator